MTITDTIHRILWRYACDPFAINTGRCEDFASDVVALLENGTVRWDAGGSHAFIELNGRFYDAQRPAGVDHWDCLPFFDLIATEL